MSEPVFEVDGAAIFAGTRVILDELKLAIAERSITCVLGPGGTGKSVLLHALAGRGLPDGLSAVGRWRFRGRPLPPTDPGQIVMWRQRRRGVPGPALRESLWREASAVLLDEPGPGVSVEADRAELAAALRELRTRSAVVMVTHDLALAREVADRVVLLCAGRIDTISSGDDFFAAPPTELAARFVAQGNCWPSHPLPSHFHWVRPGLAGMGRPGLLGDVDADLAALAASGVVQLISLTEQPLPAAELRAHGIAARHFPIADMGVPALSATMGLCRDIGRIRADGRGVAVHCHAGVGRTGTILAAFLVSIGATPDDAVEEVRHAIRGAIQSRAQLQFVYRFAEMMGGSA